MKVHLIKKLSIVDYMNGHAASKSAFNHWLSIMKNADWNSPQDILATFASADLIGKSSSRVIFNIGGNNYRMICKYAFGEKQVHLFVCWIGIHAEYTKICRVWQKTRFSSLGSKNTCLFTQVNSAIIFFRPP